MPITDGRTRSTNLVRKFGPRSRHTNRLTPHPASLSSTDHQQPRSTPVKCTVEQLSPTRVRINVEVPFQELKPDFQRAYKELAKQVRLPGFRPGKAPAKLLEARFGRAAMLEQVVNEALPGRYGQAVAESEVHPLGQPEIEVTKQEYGQDLAF